MNPAFENLSAREQAWIESYVNETIEAAEFADFQNALAASPELRAALRGYLALDGLLRENFRPRLALLDGWPAEALPPARIPLWRPIAVAAALAFLAGGVLVAMWTSSTAVTPQAEALCEGYAVIHRIQSSSPMRAGDSLEGRFVLPDGDAQLHFFCGARVTIEGPAELDIQTAWKAVCSRGNLHVQVPPAARGFVLSTPGSEIVDLGTEFALLVQDGDTTVEVLDGEVEIRHGDEEEQVLGSGQARFLPRAGVAKKVTAANLAVPDLSRLAGQYDASLRAAFERWQTHSAALAMDERLIAYYDFQGISESRIPNLARERDAERDGAVILASPVDGRWPGMKQALEFHRPGSRARVSLKGEFSAFTFAAWVRVDSLERHYNALFMSDSYQTGEPHWQIENSGRLMISVMVDDSAPNPNHKRGKGVHRIYYSPKIWGPSMSGKWLHLASVYDPVGRKACHYVDGEQVSCEEIPTRMFIDKLRIGNAEIGNWGEPFRRDEPFFAIRNLNGRIDELLLLDAALTAEDIRELWQRSK
jgi:hypothetical protein